MKLTFLFISILIITAFSRTFSQSKNYHPRPHPEDANKVMKVSAFFTSFFKYFGLPKPTQMLECFHEENAKLFFRTLFEANKILQDAVDRKVSHLDFELIKWRTMDHELHDTHHCIVKSQDFKDLLYILDFHKKHPKEFRMAFYIYYQAHYEELLKDFTPVIEDLKVRNPAAAGDAFAELVANMAETIQEEGFLHMAYSAFSNGQAIEMGVENPKDSLECFDNDAAGLYLEFTYKLADAVASGKWEESAKNANNFWEKEGQGIMNKIPANVWECWTKSKDAKKVNEKLGVDVGDMSFIDLMLKYNDERKFAYYTYMKTLKHALDDLNFNHAGTIDAHYTKAIIDFDQNHWRW